METVVQTVSKMVLGIETHRLIGVEDT